GPEQLRALKDQNSEKTNLKYGEIIAIFYKFLSSYQNPAKGVVEVWNKLGERFGSDVVLTKAYLDKIRGFPKVGYWDNKKLQELGDLLLSLQCAKDDGQLKGLRILDEPIFLRPITEKLPNDIQSRWQRHTTLRCKREKHTDYPPFSEFSKFVQDISLERNDPNLVIEHPTNDDPLCSKPRQTFKTDMKSDHDDDFRDVTQYNPNNCVLHEMPHPTHVILRLPCKVDRRTEKSRKKTPPLFSDSKFPVKCSECGSDIHLEALHVDHPPKPPKPGIDHGGAGRKETVINHLEVTTAREGSKRCCDRPVTDVLPIISVHELNKQH
ncbi:Hypothetical predicted protein, partial [Paramuricea clavata]